MTRYRKMPIVVEAIQWTGDNLAELRQFTVTRPYPNVHLRYPGDLIQLWVAKSHTWADALPIGTWIVREPDGTGCYPCSAEDFAATYEECE